MVYTCVGHPTSGGMDPSGGGGIFSRDYPLFERVLTATGPNLTNGYPLSCMEGGGGNVPKQSRDCDSCQLHVTRGQTYL